MSEFAALLSLLLVPVAWGADLSAREIVERAVNLDLGRAIESRTRIDLVEGGKTTRSRTMLYRRRARAGLESTRVDFTAPADVKGLALLIEERPGGETDQHLYTPALRRVRRIRGSLKSQEFADTDFSYEDMERRDLDDADYRLEGEEAVEGRPCFKVAGVTKKKVRSAYGRTVSWIDRESFVLRKMELFDREGKHVKTLRTLRAEPVQGVWTILAMEMENLAKGRKTVYTTETIAYDVPLNPNLFTVSALGR
jgi:hypothetical protein